MAHSLPLQLPANKAAIAASAAAASLLGALFANNRYGLSYDIRQLLSEKAFSKRMQQRVALLGDDLSLFHMWELADAQAEALWFENRRWTYFEVLDEAGKLAAILHRYGVLAGQVVAVFATNSAEMVFAIGAISRLGAVPALINTALQNQTLQHCLNIAGANLIVCTPDLAPVLADLQSSDVLRTVLSLSLSSFRPITLAPDSCTAARIVQVRYEDLASVERGDLQLPRAKSRLQDTGALIYTSGTSGKPKAVAVKNFLLVLVSTPATADVKNPRRYLPLRTYCSLPLFHATGLFSGVYYSTGLSGSFCIARKFSASRFTAQLSQSSATRMLYVGELCRYLLNAPASLFDRKHKCIVGMGNGLSRDVWLAFTQRFGIPEIREVYRSTEGIAKFDNYTRSSSGAGAVGFAGPIKQYAEDLTYIVRYDPVGETVYRDPATGFCVPAKAGEPGEAIGRVHSMDHLNNYHGDKAATESKLIRDVFQKGDIFQRTGDLLVRQPSGWIRFHDRSGDTYRWRGENVSASEVREHISKLPEVQDCSVYAVKLEGYDGQAGAATIVLSDPTKGAKFAASLYDRLRQGGLAIFQLPRLIRFRTVIETTATFKKSNMALKRLSWNPEENRVDAIYWLDKDRFRKLDSTAWRQIAGGRAKL